MVVSTTTGSIFTQRMPCSTVWRWSAPARCGMGGGGDVEGLEVGGARRRPQPEARGGGGHGRQHHDRVHLHAADAVLDGVAVVRAVAVRHGEAVVEEAEVELPGLQDAADLPVVVGREE